MQFALEDAQKPRGYSEFRKEFCRKGTRYPIAKLHGNYFILNSIIQMRGGKTMGRKVIVACGFVFVIALSSFAGSTIVT